MLHTGLKLASLILNLISLSPVVLTGTKFVLISPTTLPNPQAILQKAYQAYADQVMKNPFYTSEMPIRVKSFDDSIEKLVTAR